MSIIPSAVISISFSYSFEFTWSSSYPPGRAAWPAACWVSRSLKGLEGRTTSAPHSLWTTKMENTLKRKWAHWHVSDFASSYPPLKPLSSLPASSCTDLDEWEGPWKWLRWNGLHDSLCTQKKFTLKKKAWEGLFDTDIFPLFEHSPAVWLCIEANTFNVAADQPPLCREFLHLCDLSSTWISSSLSTTIIELHLTRFSNYKNI